MVERILYVCASPRGERSVSTQIAEVFLTALAERKAVEIDCLDPWECELPEVDGALLAAKYAGLADAPLSTARLQHGGRSRHSLNGSTGLIPWCSAYRCGISASRTSSSI